MVREREVAHRVIAFPRTASTKARLIHNAVEIASASRELSHDDVTLEMMASFEKRSMELADRWANATAGDIAAQLLRELKRKVRRRSPTCRSKSEFSKLGNSSVSGS